MGVVAPWRLALWEHSACSLPVVLLISRAGSLPLAPRAPAGVSHFRNPRRRLLELPRRRRPRPKPGNSPAIKSRACRGEGGGGGGGGAKGASCVGHNKFRKYTHKLNKRMQPFSLTLGLVKRMTSKDQVKGLSESDRSTTVFVDPFDTGSGSLKVLRRSAGRLC